MDAKELRLGNLVYGVSDRIETIVGLTDTKITAYAGSLTASAMEFEAEHFNPISLTEEWHTKFGCYKNGFHSFEYKINDRKKIIFSGDYIYLRDIQDMSNKESVGDDICVLWNNDIRRREIFVHEWQNLYFALTGEELKHK
jgi:hypothetical protein